MTEEKLKKLWFTVDAQTNQKDDVKRETVYCLDDDNETEVQKDDTIQGEEESWHWQCAWQKQGGFSFDLWNLCLI